MSWSLRRVLVGALIWFGFAGAGALLGAGPASASVVPGMPADVPAAALAPDPTYPNPSAAAWPFPNVFPATSGAGRLAGGASLWTDFLYDDYGAAGTQGINTSAFSQSSGLAARQGDYGFPSGPADNNGADIFRAGVGLHGGSSYWRVDWVTLADPKVPIAEWTFDTDNNPATGGSAWPAGAGVSSAGIERALVVSAQGAWLVDPVTGTRVDVRSVGGALTVDPVAKSFVVRVPNSVLPVSGVWRIRLGAGLASPDGRSFAAPTVGQNGPSPTAERLYNVTFRTVTQEPPVFTDGQTDAQVAAAQAALATAPLTSTFGLDGLARQITGNFWMEDDQADTLATGDVSKFSELVDWSALGARASTPEPMVTGYSVRWYVSRLGAMGHGQVVSDGPEGNFAPTLLEPLQPYAVYVPTDYVRAHPAPVTFLLHSLEVNYNQYGGYDPQLISLLCQDRHSICVTTEGLGPGGWYYNGAETDFWQVWRHVAEGFALDPSRTVISGYSMGGWASYKLAVEHPDDFAAAFVMDGPVVCGIEAVPGADFQASSSDPGCATAGTTAPLLDNVKWVPYTIDQTYADELVPITGVLSQANTFAADGDRYQLFVHTGGDHLAFAVEDRFADAVGAIGAPVRVRDPGRFTYSWYPVLDSSAFGIGATGDYWISGLAARNHAPGTLASVRADDGALPSATITPVPTGTSLSTQPIPGTVSGQIWQLGPVPAARRHLSLSLTDVGALAVDTPAARLGTGTVTVESDGPSVLTLRRLAPGTVVTEVAPRAGRVGRVRGRSPGAVRVPLDSGTTTLVLSRPRSTAHRRHRAHARR